MATVTADGNRLFQRFGILLDDGQYTVRTAEACITCRDKNYTVLFCQFFCICEISHKFMPRRTRCVRGKIDCMVVTTK